MSPDPTDPDPLDGDALRAELGLTPEALDLNRDADDGDDLLHDPDLLALRARGSLEQRQRAFEQRIQAVSQRAAELPALLQRIEGTAEDTYLAVTVGGGGGLKAVSFRPSARGAAPEQLTASFAAVYAAATEDASEQLAAAIADVRTATGPG